MNNIGTTTKTTSTGFKQYITLYRAKNCEGCPLRGICHKGLKQKADELLLSQQGILHRKQRPCDVEHVFGNIKNKKQRKKRK